MHYNDQQHAVALWNITMSNIYSIQNTIYTLDFGLFIVLHRIIKQVRINLHEQF